MSFSPMRSTLIGKEIPAFCGLPALALPKMLSSPVARRQRALERVAVNLNADGWRIVLGGIGQIQLQLAIAGFWRAFQVK